MPARTRGARATGSPTGSSKLAPDFVKVRAEGTITPEAAVVGLEVFGVDVLGLDKVDRAILDVLCSRFAGRPVGLTTLAQCIGEETETIEDAYEPYLLQQGLLQRTSRGRVAAPGPGPTSDCPSLSPRCSSRVGAARDRSSAAPSGPTPGRRGLPPWWPCRRGSRNRPGSRPPLRAGVSMDAYDYGLPESVIAQEPVEPRSAAPLLVGPGLDADGRGPAHAHHGRPARLLRPGDVLVVNDTRVLPARLALVKSTGGTPRCCCSNRVTRCGVGLGGAGPARPAPARPTLLHEFEGGAHRWSRWEGPSWSADRRAAH